MEALQSADRADERGTRHAAGDAFTHAIIAAWNVTAGEWRLGDVHDLAELVGVADPEILIHGLQTIRAYMRAKSDAESHG